LAGSDHACGGSGVGGIDNRDSNESRCNAGQRHLHMDELPPRAEKGKSVKVAWNQLVTWAVGVRLLPGRGVRLARSRRGTIVSFVPERQRFTGAFHAMPGNKEVRFAFGTIEGLEPTAGGKPISDPESKLKLADGKFDKAGRSWLGILLKQDEEGKLDTKAKDVATMVQADSPGGGTKNGEHFHPVALIKRTKVAGVETTRFYQIEYFHLRVARKDRKLFVFPAA
jgi:hypothetical protein